MRIFDREHPWPSKVNFIDANNLVLGYDLLEQCCEDSDWFIFDDIKEGIKITAGYMSESERAKLKGNDIDLTEYFFDVDFIEKHGDADRCITEVAIFKIFAIKRDSQRNMIRDEKYIFLMNDHNGYYSHGFSFSEIKDIKCGEI